jgi:hypothetical protein
MRLYIANCTQQVQTFMYRTPEESGAMSGGMRVQHIEIGAQIPITGDLNKIQIDSIVAQHSKYGLISVDEVDRNKAFAGLCYSIDKPVPISKLLYVMQNNKKLMDERGRKTRLEAAIAVNQQVENNMADQLKKLEIEVKEEKSGSGPEHEPVNEALRVTRSEDPTPIKEANQSRRGRQRNG